MPGSFVWPAVVFLTRAVERIPSFFLLQSAVQCQWHCTGHLLRSYEPLFNLNFQVLADNLNYAHWHVLKAFLLSLY